MATLSNGIPEGNKPPLIRLDDNHHGSWLVICSAFGLVIILLTLTIRIYLRYRVSPPFAADDIALTISTALAVIQCSLVFVGVSKGDGTSTDLIDENHIVAIQKVGFEMIHQELNNILIATAQLRKQHILHLRPIRLKTLRRASLQANILRNLPQEDCMDCTRYHHYHRLHIRLLMRFAMQPERALDHLRHQVRRSV
jgi:hypothetical protein